MINWLATITIYLNVNSSKALNSKENCSLDMFFHTNFRMTESEAVISEERCSLHRAHSTFTIHKKKPYQSWTGGCQVHEVCRFIAAFREYDILQKILSNSTEILISKISGQTITKGMEKCMSLTMIKSRILHTTPFEWLASFLSASVDAAATSASLPEE